MRAYNQAMATNEAISDFYLKYVKKVNFTDKLKDPKEFRTWKEQQDGAPRPECALIPTTTSPIRLRGNGPSSFSNC